MDNTLPMVTICMPSYNYGSIIGRAIDGVLGQSYPHLELIIGENGSTDTTESVLAHYANDARVRVIRHPKNLGHIGNWQACIAEARGAFLSYISADDQMLPHHIERLLAPMMDPRQPADLTWGGVIHAGAQNREVICKMYEWFPLGFSDRNDYGYTLAMSCQISGASFLWRHAVFKELGGFKPNYGLAMEFEIPLRFARANRRIVHIPDITALHTMHTDQLSRKFESQNDLYHGYLDMLDEYAVPDEHWRFSGFEHRISAHLQRYWQHVVLPSVERELPNAQEIVARHRKMEERILQFRDSRPASIPADIPRVSLIAACSGSLPEINSILANVERQEYGDWELIIYQYGPISYEGYVRAHPLARKIRYTHAPVMDLNSCWVHAQELRRGELISYVEPGVMLEATHLKTLVHCLDLSQTMVVVGKSVSQIGGPGESLAEEQAGQRYFKATEVDYPKNPLPLKSLILHRYTVLNYIPIETVNFSALSCVRKNYNEWAFLLKCQNASIPIGVCTMPTAIACYNGQQYWDFWTTCASSKIVPILRDIHLAYPAAIAQQHAQREQMITALDMCLQAVSDMPYAPALIGVLEGMMQSLGLKQDLTPAPQEVTLIV